MPALRSVAWQIEVTLGAALLTQYAGTRLCTLPSFDPRSPLISALSLCLMLRTINFPVSALAAFNAIVGKFATHWRGEHLFYRTNLVLVIMLDRLPSH